VRLVLAVGVLIALILAAWGLISRHRAEAALRAETEQAAIPIVTLVAAAAEPDGQEIELPGTVQAYSEAPIYARASGYVKAWYTDIGARVRAGQVMAVLDTPDVDDQARQAQADLANAEATYDLARTTARRWLKLRRTDSVSQQDADEKAADAKAKKAALEAAAANAARLRQMQDFKRVVAPFDGVVTARLTDIGALIADGVATELFRVADIAKLRVFSQVPQLYASELKVGDAVDLTFAEYPGRIFKAKLARTSNALDPSSRTLLVELDLDNADGLLLPGGYTQAHFKAVSPAPRARVPASALLFRADGLHVAALAPRDMDKAAPGSEVAIALRSVVLGRDFGATVEIASGIAPGETILANPPDSALDGEIVRVAAGPGGPRP
jgi:RND family efflux transporter MFP subunit